jgi:hypothetical protein
MARFRQWASGGSEPGRRLTLPFRCERQEAEEEVLPIEAAMQALPSASQGEAGLRRPVQRLAYPATHERVLHDLRIDPAWSICTSFLRQVGAPEPKAKA